MLNGSVAPAGSSVFFGLIFDVFTVIYFLVLVGFCVNSASLTILLYSLY